MTNIILHSQPKLGKKIAEAGELSIGDEITMRD
jgi:hypothetical protein